MNSKDTYIVDFSSGKFNEKFKLPFSKFTKLFTDPNTIMLIYNQNVQNLIAIIIKQ